MKDSSEDGRIRKILIIEDDRDYRNLLKTYLTKHIQDVQIVEYDPVSRGAPPENFDWSPYDILILDYYLCIYGLTGLDLLQKHRRKPGFPATLMITGAGDEEVAVRALNFGVYEYLRKEKLTREGLIESVNNAFNKHKGDQVTLREQGRISQAFDKTLFYRELEHPSDAADGSKERALILVDVDDMDKLANVFGFIVHDNLLRHMARLGYENLSSIYDELYITRLTDTSVAILITAPNQKENLEKEIRGLCDQFQKNTYLFGDKPVDYTVSIGALLIDQKDTPTDLVIKSATYACDVARHTSGNSSHILSLKEYQEKERQHQEEQQRKLESEEQQRQEQQQREQVERQRKEEQQKLEAERQQLAEEKRKLEAEEQKRLQELKRREEEEKRKEEEEKRKIEEERKQLEVERQRLAEEKRKLEEEEQKRQAELQQREAGEKRKEEEERQKLEEERKRLDTERKRIAEEKRQLEEAEKKRIEELRKREEEDKRKEEEERQQLEAERKRLAEEKRQLQEEEKKRIEELQKHEADEKRRELEKQRKLEEERLQLEKERRQLEEEKRHRAEEQERLRIIEAEKKRREEEERLQQMELERQRKEEEARRMAKEERRRREEQQRLLEEKKEKLRLAEEERKRKEEKLRKLEEENRKAEEKRRYEKEEKRKAEELRRKEREEKSRLAEKERQKTDPSGDNKGESPSDDEILSFPLDVSVSPEAGVSVNKIFKKDTDEQKQKVNEQKREEETSAAQESRGKTTPGNEVVVNESELDTHALAIKKAFNENRSVQTFQPIVAMFTPEPEKATALFRVGVQVIDGDGSITTGDEIKKRNTTLSLQQFIDRWLLRETVGRIVNNPDLQAGKIFIITIGEAWLKDITLFNWLKDLLAGLENIKPARSIALEIPASLLIEHSKRALPLINALKKSYGFRVALGDIKSVDEISKLFKVLDFNLLVINSAHAEELSNKTDENEIEALKQHGARLVVDGIEDATMMTKAISQGADYVMGSFIGGPETIITGTGQVESLDIIYNAF